MELQERLLREISGIDRLTRGSLHAKGCAKSGRVFYNLMYRRQTRLFSRHVGVKALPAYRASVRAHERLRDLFERYVDEMTKKTIREIEKEAKACRSRKS